MMSRMAVSSPPGVSILRITALLPCSAAFSMLRAMKSLIAGPMGPLTSIMTASARSLSCPAMCALASSSPSKITATYLMATAKQLN